MNLPFAAADVVKTARAQVGRAETPLGSNVQPYSEAFGAAGPGWPAWCGYFVGWVFRALGWDIRTVAKSFMWTPGFYSQVRAAGWPRVNRNDVRAGDIVFIDWTGDGQIDHVCFAVGGMAGGRVPTIGGNESNRVSEGYKDAAKIYSVVRPPYQPAPAPTPVPTPPANVKRRYTVKRGDTLSAIGRRFGVDWRAIYAANRAVIGANPDLIKPGQVLTIP